MTTYHLEVLTEDCTSWAFHCSGTLDEVSRAWERLNAEGHVCRIRDGGPIDRTEERTTR